MERTASGATASKIPGRLEPVTGSPTHDPVLNMEQESSLMKAVEVPSFRVWRSADSIVLGRFLVPEEELHLSRAEELGVPVLKRPSGGGAVFHDLGNVNYSIYLPPGRFPRPGIEKSLQLLSFPVTELLESLGVAWSWEPPNNVYVQGAKISGSAQARSRGRLLHHGTLLVRTDLDRMRELLKPGGRSRIAPVVNLSNILPGVTPEDAASHLSDILQRIPDAWCPPHGVRDCYPIEEVGMPDFEVVPATCYGWPTPASSPEQ